MKDSMLTMNATRRKNYDGADGEDSGDELHDYARDEEGRFWSSLCRVLVSSAFIRAGIRRDRK